MFNIGEKQQEHKVQEVHKDNPAITAQIVDQARPIPMDQYIAQASTV